MSDASSAAAAGSSELDKEDDDAAVAAAAEARMASIHRGFASAKAKGIQAATRLMKELRQARRDVYSRKFLLRERSTSTYPRPPACSIPRFASQAPSRWTSSTTT
eukprot:scaffold7695_cov124-Isochrysis_galbana.AAC.14